ncbi:guanine deaminase [Geopseudomonas guangdongensis]|uniref:Guanine deaminase n=1 Tax=Geopseudomonas guangdongensis TaxID=1245526 RepID=A0A1H2GWL3_9GAMM|nr:guanine deaminase [Pseudomonas guangdongensis]SDU23984.1 guanine deaminase [Pseudomonas guangdongensis]
MPTAYRSALLYSLDDPATVGAAASYRHHEDGLLLVEDGLIRACGPAGELLPGLPAGTPLRHWPDALIVPGFVDTHIHYPQTGMIGAAGEQLLDWLARYTYPAERRFADSAYAERVARIFVAELLRNGTTTAQVFASVHPASVDAFFTVAAELDLRMLCGKVLMDRNAPPELCDSADSGYAQSRALIERWHGHGRLGYAVTPRFAGSCSSAQLRRAAQLLDEFPTVRLHTHLAENRAEIAWIESLFPDCASYLDVYARHGLLGPRALFAHAIHLDDGDCRRLSRCGAAVAFCPSSNLFLGSGLFDLARAERLGLKVGIGSDIGAGTSFSLLRTLGEAYKVEQLQGRSLDPFKALYLATLGGARALGLEGRIGSLAPGHEADFVVLDPQATPLLRFRLEECTDLAERLAVLLTLGDDRVVRETFVAGVSRHRRDG